MTLGTRSADTRRMEDKPTARKCERCGKSGGCVPIARRGYWHLACWRKAIAARKAQP